MGYTEKEQALINGVEFGIDYGLEINPEDVTEYHRLTGSRRANINNEEQIKRRRLSAKERKQIFDTYKGHCAYCGAEIKFRGMQIDHKTPLRLNGPDTLENMFPACRSCNHYKHTMDIEGFREYLEGIPKRLNRDSIAYQVGKRFGLVQVKEEKVKFYFEKTESEHK